MLGLGQRRSLDASWYLQKYVPRRPRSRWSLVNVRRVEALRTAGRMRPPGEAEVDAARRDGRWGTAYLPQAEFRVPEDVPADLRTALAADDPAAAAFDALSRTEQYAVVLDLLTMRDPDRRAAKVSRAVARLSGRAG